MYNIGNGEDEEEIVYFGILLMDGNDYLVDIEIVFLDIVFCEVSIKFVSFVVRYVSDGEIIKLKDREKVVKDMRDYISCYY